MEQEIVTDTQPQYKPLESFSKKELQDVADKLDLKLPVSMGISKMAQAIRVRQTRLSLDAQAEAMTQRRAESLDTERKPSFEEILIFGGEFMGKKYDPSPKNIYSFRNELDPGESQSFTKGGILFQIFEKDKHGNPLTCVMPACLCEKVPKPRTGATRTELLEYELLKAISLGEPNVPINANRTDPATGASISTIVGYRPRFTFIRIGKAPADAPFGVYLEDVVEELSPLTNESSSFLNMFSVIHSLNWDSMLGIAL